MFKEIYARDIVNGRVSLENLPEPYLIIIGGISSKTMTEAINILATKKGYRNTSH
jgi:hypothetical protein